MKKLILMRHAKAVSEDLQTSDYLRSLATRGIEEAQIIGNYLKARHYIPQIIIASSALRTLQTAEVIGKYINYETAAIQHSKALYLGTADDIWQVITEIAESCETAIVVAHNPTVAEILQPLMKKRKLDIFDFPTLCTGVLTVEGTWQDFTFENCQMEDYFTPKMVL
ncbi:MAG TPA: hypothetical protein DCQ31_08850 [Bacteroidales bacterium]|nr:hypothetical protein [Bacteroidales bacterium]